MIDNSNLIKSIVLSIFNEDGPTPIVYWPNNLDETARLLIAMKTISLLMGDSKYQDGVDIDGINYFGVLPFPDINLIGLTYFFLISDENARGHAKAATITVLINETKSTFFYQNMKYLSILMDKASTQIQAAETLEETKQIMNDLKSELFTFTNEIKDPYSTKRKIKILFTGLDRAGKTSFLYGVKKRYSEIIKTLPTKGVHRSEENVFAEQNSTISIWDLGGQMKYRQKYFEQSKIYLYNVDLMYFFIDIQNTERIPEAIDLLKKILHSLKEFQEYPPIIICLNKFDPDIQQYEEIRLNVLRATEQISQLSNKFFLKIFQTSVFIHWSLISAYSYGLSQLSPNRELFRTQLKRLSRQTNSDALLLLNENGIILSNYSKDMISGKVFEISAPHFQTLYKTFKEFKLLKKDFIISSGISQQSKKLVFKKIKVDKYNLYLLFFMDKDFGIERIEESLPTFSKNIVDLINTYI